MSEIALTLLRLGFLLILWLVIFAILGLLRRDLRQAERRTGNARVSAVTPAEPKPARRPNLRHVTVKDESGQETQFELFDGMSFGRSADCSIVLVDDYASSRHAIVSRDDAGWVYTDQGSTNGSWVDRKRLEEPLRLKRGALVRIGHSTLRFDK